MKRSIATPAAPDRAVRTPESHAHKAPVPAGVPDVLPSSAVLRQPRTLLALQRTVGNTAVQRLLGASAPTIQRTPGGNRSGRRQGTVVVRWAEDHVDFLHNLAAAVVRTLRVERSALFVPLMNSAYAFHAAHARDQGLREGKRLSVYVSLCYADPGQWSSKISDVVVTMPPSPTPPTKQPAPAQLPPKQHQPQPGETDEQRLWRQANTTIEVLSRVVARADQQGHAGIVIVIAHTGRELEPRHMEVVKAQKPRPSNMAPMTASTAEKEHVRPSVESFLIGGAGEVVLTFQRDDWGVMRQLKFQRRPLPPVAKGGGYRPRTTREMLDEHGIPDPKKIWTEIGEKWEQEVKDAGMMVLTFGITEVATWIVGGGLLKVLGVGLGRLRHLYRLIKGKNTKAVAEGLARLGKGEADEFGQLLSRVNRGERLSPAEAKRLEELAGRLDDALAPGAKTGQQAADKSATGGSKPPKSQFDDEPTIPDARKPLPGQPRLVNRSTPDRYWVSDSTNPLFSAEAHLEAGSELSMVLRTTYGGERSSVLLGHEQFRAMLKHFGGRVKGIRGAWSYETNLTKFNELVAAGKSAKEAALGTWTGEQAAAAGFKKVTVRTLEGKPGSYSKVDVLFHP